MMSGNWSLCVLTIIFLFSSHGYRISKYYWNSPAGKEIFAFDNLVRGHPLFNAC